MKLTELDIKTVSPHRLDDLMSFDPLLITSLIVLSSGAVGVLSLVPMKEEVSDEIIVTLPDMEWESYNEDDMRPKTYRIFGINIYDEDFYSIDAIGFNSRVLDVARIVKERMKRDGIKDAFFPAFLRNEGAFQPWGAITSFFEGIDGDMPRSIRGGNARAINDEYLIFAQGKELAKSKISSLKGIRWDYETIAGFPAEIVFISRVNELNVYITLINGDVYSFNTVSYCLFKKSKNIRAWVGQTKCGVVFFRDRELVIRNPNI